VQQSRGLLELRALWGANVLSTHPHLWRPILEARKNGARVVAIDPIRTRTAAVSDWHLAPKPGTDADNPPVKALFVCASNPAVSIPHQTKVLRGLSRDDLFTVVVEHFLTDTTRYADVVLPATMAIEHRDLLIAYGHLYVAWNEPAVPPPGDCLPTTEIFRRLARAMTLDEPALYDSDESMACQLLESGHPSLIGISLDTLKERGSIRLNYPDPFVPFATSFPTASGRLEFVSDRMAQVGLDPVAGYTPSYEAAQDDTALAREYPLALVTPANHSFLNSIFANVPQQLRRSGAATLLIHPEDAAPRRIGAGDEVRVANARGSFVAVADVSDRIRQGVVATTKGHWPRDAKEGTTVNATVDERDSDMGGGAVYHDNRVRVDRTC
jgi:anaerobic selenocysteine-containing dehydrogenase